MRIKELRRAAGLTQTQLAENVGVTQGMVAAWEQGANFPRADKLPALAKALGVTINDLYKFESA